MTKTQLANQFSALSYFFFMLSEPTALMVLESNQAGQRGAEGAYLPALGLCPVWGAGVATLKTHYRPLD